MKYFAQTNIALYEQMSGHGYSIDAIGKTKVAYQLAAVSSSVYFRSSGKPFICHLVGVASILVELHAPTEVVIAGLLHAALNPKMDFDDGDIKKKLETLQRKFGDRVAHLVEQYRQYEWKYADAGTVSVAASTLDQDARDVMLIRVANELEDLLNNAVNYTGAPDERGDVRKSHAWRKSYLTEMGDELAATARELGHPSLAEWLEDEVRTSMSTEIPPELRSGARKMFRKLSPSLFDDREHTLIRRLRRFFRLVKGS